MGPWVWGGGKCASLCFSRVVNVDGRQPGERKAEAVAVQRRDLHNGEFTGALAGDGAAWMQRTARRRKRPCVSGFGPCLPWQCCCKACGGVGGRAGAGAVNGFVLNMVSFDRLWDLPGGFF